MSQTGGQCPLCGADLYMVHSFAVPVDDDYAWGLDAACAVTRDWLVECANGHRVMVPEGADDYQELPNEDAMRAFAAPSGETAQ